MEYLTDEVLWLTGASSGIGEAFARVAAKKGYRLALSARRKELLENLSNEIKLNNPQLEAPLVLALDVTNLDEVKNAYKQICNTWGKVDLLVANAGSHLPTNAKDFNTQEYRKLFELNLFGALNCIEAVLPGMIERKSGHIIGVSSVAGYRALPTSAAYGASKAALSHFLHSLRFDLKPLGIDVSVISPGFVKTPLTDKNTFPMPCIIEVEIAAKEMLSGIESKKHEIHFPKRFSYFLKALGFLPHPTYHWLISKLTGK